MSVKMQDIQLEQTVLGSILIDASYCVTAMEFLSEDCFSSEQHIILYNAIMRLSQKAMPIDQLTVLEELQRTGELVRAGGAGYLVELTKNIGAAIHVEAHALMLRERALRRNLYVFAERLAMRTKEKTGDIGEIIEKAEQQFFEITSKKNIRRVRSSESVLEETMEYINKQNSLQAKQSGVLSGFYSVDVLTNGWQRGNLVILAARPSMGKTALALSFARQAVFGGEKGVLFFSLEMTSRELMLRILASETEIPATKLQHQTLSNTEWRKLEKIQQSIIDAQLYIDDTPGISISELRSKARQMKMKHNIDMIVIDYLQLMHVSKAYSRENEVAQISQGLKNLAKELDVPVIALSQLNRGVASRLDKRPMLSDLRDSGAIEQDADIVMFVHRPEYYGLTATDTGESTEGLTELIFAKNRNGKFGDVNLRFVPEIVSFREQVPELVDDGFDNPFTGF